MSATYDLLGPEAFLDQCMPGGVADVLIGGNGNERKLRRLMSDRDIPLAEPELERGRWRRRIRLRDLVPFAEITPATVAAAKASYAAEVRRQNAYHASRRSPPPPPPAQGTPR